MADSARANASTWVEIAPADVVLSRAALRNGALLGDDGVPNEAWKAMSFLHLVQLKPIL